MKRRGSAAPLGGVALLSDGCATLTIALTGRLDGAAAGRLQCLIDGALASGARQVRFDLADVSGCDGPGSRLLQWAGDRLAAVGLDVSLTGPTLAEVATREVVRAQ